MGRDVLSLRQIMVMAVTALLAPMTALLPGLTTHAAGSGGWLAVLGAIPLLLVALWTVKYARLVGRRWICAINVLYLIWIPLLLASFLYLSQVRLAAIYGEKTGTVFITVLILPAVWMALKKVSAFARAAEIFYLLLAVVLAGVLLMAAFKVEWRNLSLTGAELTEVPRGSAAVAGIILNVYPIAVLKNKAAQRAGDGRKAIGWIAALSLVLSLAVAVMTGCLGPVLTSRVTSPFLIMVQGLGVKGAFQRMEALIAAIWVVSDLTMAGVLLHVWRELANEIRSGEWCRWGVIPVAVAALGAVWFLMPDETVIQYIYSILLPVGGLVSGLLIPVFLCLIAKLSKKDL